MAAGKGQGERALVAGVDVGGTKIAAALVDAEGRIAGRVQRPTDTSSDEMTLRGIAAAVDEAIAAAGCPHEAVRAVGLGIPGKVDPERGVGVLSVNLGWRDVAVVERLEALTGLPCAVENDVKAAALGEHRYGAGRGLKNMVYLNVGTGIAAGIVIAGRLYRGSSGMAGEVGHAALDRRGPRCKCGATGCFEAMAAGPAIAAQARAAVASGRDTVLRQALAGEGERLSAAAIFTAAAAGDAVASAILAEVGSHLAQAIEWLIMAFDPELIVLGGGVFSGGAGCVLLEAVRCQLVAQAAQSFVAREMLRPERVQVTRLGGDIGILGAAALVAPR